MKDRQLTTERLTAYRQHLLAEEHSPDTIDKYLRDVMTFAQWLDGRNADKETAAQWKTCLLNKKYAPVTINSMLSALNGLFKFLGWNECCVKFLKLQRRLFREAGKELTRMEYERLLVTAKKRGQERLALVIETICATGIRVSEIRYVSVEAARRGRAEIALKGKVRVILLPEKLCRKLLKYAKKQEIVSGEVFLTRTGRSLSRRQIWAEMKGLCREAGVDAGKVFPHNLRHLFARTFYKVCRDVARLADVLGHSSIETTRLYLISTGVEHAKTLEQMRLVS